MYKLGLEKAKEPERCSWYRSPLGSPQRWHHLIDWALRFFFSLIFYLCSWHFLHSTPCSELHRLGLVYPIGTEDDSGMWGLQDSQGSRKCLRPDKCSLIQNMNNSSNNQIFSSKNIYFRNSWWSVVRTRGFHCRGQLRSRVLWQVQKKRKKKLFQKQSYIIYFKHLSGNSLM